MLLRHLIQTFQRKVLVGLNGLEPSTSRLSGGRSNLLSYKPKLVEIIGIEPMTPCLQSRCSPSWAIPPLIRFGSSLFLFKGSSVVLHNAPLFGNLCYEPQKLNNDSNLGPNGFHRSDLGSLATYLLGCLFSIERRWSSRTFRYGYLVTTSPQSPILPSAAPSLRLGYWLRVLPALMVWRAVCTRPGNVFTAACWSAITSNSNFI